MPGTGPAFPVFERLSFPPGRRCSLVKRTRRAERFLSHPFSGLDDPRFLAAQREPRNALFSANRADTTFV